MNRKNIFHVKALTEIWTGNENRRNDRLRETGLIGSMRWWYEALVRGLGGLACGAASGGCSYEPDKKDKTGLEIPREKQICSVCELFGCTGWSCKFRLRLLNSERFLEPINCLREKEFFLELLWLKEPKKAEVWLLDKSIGIASKYGSIGGKTVLKPQDKVSLGKDYGLFEIVTGLFVSSSLEEVKEFLGLYKSGWENDQEYPDLRYFFFSQGSFLDRRQMNEFINALPDKAIKYGRRSTKAFMKGDRGDSKKIFSFRSGRGRVWGYTRDEEELQIVVNVLKNEQGLTNLITGEEMMAGEL